MKKYLKVLSVFTLAMFGFTKKLYAQASADELVGSVDTPPGVELINIEAGAGNIGILLFVSNMIKFVTTLAGLFVIVNFFMAAFIYITGGGKADNHQKVVDKVSMSVIGLVLIVSSYTIGGLIGFIFFGRADYLLTPTLTEIGGL